MVITAKVIENSAFVLLARINGSDGTPLQQADIDTIVLRAFVNSGATAGTLIVPDGEDPETYDGTALDPVDVISDTLVTDDARWTKDDIGYNFVAVLDGSYAPDSSVRVQVELQIQPVIGPSIIQPFVLTVTNTWTGDV